MLDPDLLRRLADSNSELFSEEREIVRQAAVELEKMKSALLWYAENPGPSYLYDDGGALAKNTLIELGEVFE